MNNVTCQASRSRHRPTTRKPLWLTSLPLPSACGVQISSTMKAGSAHAASAPDQEPVTRCSMGNVRPDAEAAPAHSAMV